MAAHAGQGRTEVATRKRGARPGRSSGASARRCRPGFVRRCGDRCLALGTGRGARPARRRSLRQPDRAARPRPGAEAGLRRPGRELGRCTDPAPHPRGVRRARGGRTPLPGRARPGPQPRQHPPPAAGAGPRARRRAAAVRHLRRRRGADLLRLRLHRASDLRSDHGAADHAGGRRVRRRGRPASRAGPGPCRACPASPAGQARPRRGACPVGPGDPPGPRHRAGGLRDRLRRRARALSPRVAAAAAAPAHPGDLGRLRHRRSRRHRLDRHLRQAAAGAARPAAPLPWHHPGLPRQGDRRIVAGAAPGAPRGAPGTRDQVGRGRPRGARRHRPAGRRVAQAAGPRRPRHGQEPRYAPLPRRPGARPGRPCPGGGARRRAGPRLVHPARRAHGPGPGRRRHAGADQRHPAAQRDPQDHRHGPCAGRPDAPADLRQRDRAADRVRRARDHQLRLGHRRTGHGPADVHDRGADAQASRRQRADPVPGRRVRDLVHHPDRALLRAPVRGRGADRHLAPVRDPHRPGARGRDHRRCPGRAGLPRLSAQARPHLHPDRLLRRRPLHGPARGLRADREDPAGHGRGAGGPWPHRPRAHDLRHPRREHRPRRPSGQLPGPPALLRHAREPAPLCRRGHRTAPGDQLPGRRRLPLLPGTAECAGGDHPHPRALPDARGRGRRPVLRRAGLCRRVLRRRGAVQQGADREPLLRQLPGRLQRQHALHDGLALAEAAV